MGSCKCDRFCDLVTTVIARTNQNNILCEASLGAVEDGEDGTGLLAELRVFDDSFTKDEPFIRGRCSSNQLNLFFLDLLYVSSLSLS